MNCLSSVCFLCLNNNDIVNYTTLQDSGNDIILQVKFVLPEIVILEPRLSLLICSACRQVLDDFHNFKKMCLDNNYRYNEYINKLQGANDSFERKFGELHVNMNENVLLSNVKKEGNIEEIEAVENFVEDAIEFKEMLDFTEELTTSEESKDPLYRHILKNETDSNHVQDYERNITKIKIHSREQEATKDMCQATDLKCLVCHDMFVEKSHLQKHMLIVHTNAKERKCLVCGKMFSRNSSLLIHMKAHAKIKDYKCSVCNRRFLLNSSLKLHMIKIHIDAKDYKCSICNKTFNLRTTLKFHMTTHMGAKDYKCSICNKLFKLKSYLKRHMTIHTGIKKYKCSICNKLFSQSATLKYHMTTHTGAKDYKCSICNKLFSLKSHLKRHMTTHTGIKEYKCSICNKMFSQSATLNRHTKSHTGVKDYKCSICNKMFSRSENLITHMKIHEG